jgi:hypothetical protein
MATKTGSCLIAGCSMAMNPAAACSHMAGSGLEPKDSKVCCLDWTFYLSHKMLMRGFATLLPVPTAACAFGSPILFEVEITELKQTITQLKPQCRVCVIRHRAGLAVFRLLINLEN